MTLTGWDIAKTLRALLPEPGQYVFDEMLTVYSHSMTDVSACGAFSSLGPAFQAAVDARDEATVAAVLREVDRVMAECEDGLADPDVDHLHTAVVTCFLENVLPVGADEFDLVAPHIGPATRRWADVQQPWWLEPMGF